MTDEEYWKKRNEELEAVWNQKSKKEIEKEFAKLYQQSLEHIETKINALYARFADDNGLDMVEAQRLLQGSEFRTWRMDAEDYLKVIKETGNKELEKEFNILAMRSRITRLDKLKAETIVELAKLGEKVGKGIDGFLPSAYQDFYYHSLFDIGKRHGLLGAVSRVNTKELEGVLRTPWSGMNYSQRIWKNSKKLSDVLEKEVFAAAHRGASVKDVSRIVSQRMNVSLGNATRLVRTELNYVENRAVHDSIKKSGMKYYRFVATLDKRTSQQCRSHDGNVYPIDDYSPGTNAPPLHPHCRSIIVGSLKGDARPTGSRAARDKNNQYTRIPASTTYSQWVTSL